MPTAMYRRGNYSSGEDFVLEYGDLRFTFNERDFRERCEQAARRLGFIGSSIEEDEAEDLINLVVNGEVTDPASALGEHVNDCWPELVGPSDRSLVHWLRRLIFRSAWLDQRVKEGELDVQFDDDASSFIYIQPDRGGEPIELAPEPSWGRVAYVRRRPATPPPHRRIRSSIMSARVWIVIPTYNEAENVSPIVRAVVGELERAIPEDFRVLVVDDNSPDGTGQIADGLAAELECVEVLHRMEKNGLGQAYLAGFGRALAEGAQLIMEMDADFSHDPRYLKDLIAAADDADLVLGSRYVPGGGVRNWGTVRRLISRGGGIYARMILGIHIHDLTGGFKCIRREVLEAIDLPSLRAEGYVFQIEVTYRAIQAGFRVVEVPIVFCDRTVGTSKMSSRIALEAMLLVPRLRYGRRAAAARRALPHA